MVPDTTYYRRKAQGLCTACGQTKSESGGSSTYCAECRRIKKLQQRMRAQRLKAELHRELKLGMIRPERGLLESPDPPKERHRVIFGRNRDELAHLKGQ